jgi:hypothetical protein
VAPGASTSTAGPAAATPATPATSPGGTAVPPSI